MTSLRLLALIPLGSLFLACDSDGGGGNGDPLTGCALSFAVSNASGKAYGMACTSDAECMYGECMMPGDTGNITNTKFGFCTRGCDCENDTSSRLPADQKDALDCLYPSGFKDRHHVVVECTSLATCQGLDAGWTSCELPDTGGARQVCHAL